MGSAFVPTAARTAPTAVDHAAAAAATPGRELEPRVRETAESDLGTSFADVRIHTDATAAAAADRLDADAFTIGRHVVFGAERYAPGTPAGHDLLRHELVHVAQQGEATPGARLAVGEANTTLERDARNGALGGRSDELLIQRQPRGAGQRGYISTITVNQAGKQTVTWTGVGGVASGSARCSTGKGHCCCTDPALPACTHRGSNADGSNYTPEGTFTLANKQEANPDHPPFWMEFVTARAIALHEYTPVDGTPLSHGCVRLDRAVAEQLFRGVIPHRTVIHVVGLPTPLCSHPALQEEWARDYSKVQARDGEETKAFMSAFGTDEAGAGIEAAVPGPSPTASTVAARIPRCLGDLTSPEERNLAAAPAGTLPATVGLTGFARSLRRAETIAAARTVVEQFGRGLWNAARGRAQRARGADFDDRPLYLGRLRAQQTVRAWDPPNPDVRRRGIPELLSALEDASRGYDTASFGTPAPGAAAAKRVVVSGFDPFGGTIGSADSSNPSASAALLLDGTTIGTRPALGRVEGVVFPVRFRDFTEGVAERVMRPLIIGPPPADLVVSISRGGSDFELEEWAGGRRSSRENDNTGVAGNTLPAAGPGASVADRERATAGPVIPGPGTNQEAFRHSVRPSTLAAMRGGRTTPNANEITLKEADESAHTRGGMRERTSPSGQHPVAEGAGGGYLSNEIFYRNRRLAGANTPIPIIHLHVPEVDATDSSRTSAAIARRAKQIIEAALPTLP